MNRVIAALCILALCIAFVGVHTYKILVLNRDVSAICNEIEEEFDQENWRGVRDKLSQVENCWNNNRFWACLTIDTEEIEEIEISLRQSIEYADIRAKEDFIGEFIMFRMQLEHLPHQEGFSVEELL